ncbi:MAG TPA: hypothetical protein VHM24_01670 [Gemmatimonadaceae bacterium]|nr:hypothetical protein [Gemmatimonadaceae bacterium]
MAENAGVLEAGKAARRGADYSAIRDADLILAMRREEQGAFVEFVERFRMLAWDQARHLGVAAAERKSWTEEVLHNCALALVRDGAAIPGNLAGYIVVSLRRKYFDQDQRSRKERSILRELADELPSGTTELEDGTERGLPEAVVHLSEAIVATLSEEEELLLVWKGHRITHGTMAEWLGLSRDAVGQRLWRLKQRLLIVTEGILASMNADDRAIIRRFLDGGEEHRGE